MPFYHATMRLAADSGVPADATENTFAFSGSNLGTDPAAIDTLLNDLYDDLVGIYPGLVDQTGHELSIINLDDLQPRYPIYQAAYAFPSGPTGGAAPREFAICASFQAVRQSGIPQSRRRGRVYLGPLDAAAFDANGNVAAATITTIVNAMTAFKAAAAASAVVWSVYSRVDQDLYEVDNGWVDNAPDIQRRRGSEATSRTTF